MFVGEVSKPESLAGLCKGIDVFFSSIGITRQRERIGFMEVDYGGNSNILGLDLKTSVQKFIFVSTFNAHLLKEFIDPRELFVEELKN